MRTSWHTSCMMESKACWNVSDRGSLANWLQLTMCSGPDSAVSALPHVHDSPSKPARGSDRCSATAQAKSAPEMWWGPGWFRRWNHDMPSHPA